MRRRKRGESESERKEKKEDDCRSPLLSQRAHTQWIAMKLASNAGTPKRLFLVVFGLSSVLAVFTSNDTGGHGWERSVHFSGCLFCHVACLLSQSM
jgi:hypothetical protein